VAAAVAHRDRRDHPDTVVAQGARAVRARAGLGVAAGAPTARPFGRLGAVLGASKSTSIAPASAPSWALPLSEAVRSVRSGRRLAEGVAEGAACTSPVASAPSLRDPILRRLT
jgi:hypothetical protein